MRSDQGVHRGAEMRQKLDSHGKTLRSWLHHAGLVDYEDAKVDELDAVVRAEACPDLLAPILREGVDEPVVHAALPRPARWTRSKLRRISGSVTVMVSRAIDVSPGFSAFSVKTAGLAGVAGPS